MPLNLGYANGTRLPEDERARVLKDAADNGYAPEMGDTGLTDGSAAPPSVDEAGATGLPPPGSAPAASQPITKNDAPLVDWKKDKLGAIGLVLSSIAAGMQGQPSPVQALRDQRAEEQKAQQQAEGQMQARKMQVMSLALQAIENGIKFAVNAPPDQREAVIDHFSQSMAKMLPGVDPKADLGDMIRAGVSGKVNNALEVIPLLRELGSAELATMYGRLALRNPEAAQKFGETLLAAAATKTGSAPKPGETQAQARERAAGEREGAPPKTPDQIGQEAEAGEAGRLRARAAAGPDPTEAAAKATAQENTLRGEFTRGSARFVAMRDAFQKVRASANRKTATGDISLVFAYMKMLDDTSTVREGEAATVEQARGVPSGILNLYNRLVNGERLTAEQRADITGSSRVLYSEAKKNHDKFIKQYEGLAGGSGARRENVIIDYSDESLDEDESAAPPDGAIRYDENGNRLP